jgi:hypothetical protein
MESMNRSAVDQPVQPRATLSGFSPRALHLSDLTVRAMGHKFDVMSTSFLSSGILSFFLSRKLFRNARGTFTPSCPLILVRHYMNIFLTHIYRASFDLDDRSDFSDSPRHDTHRLPGSFSEKEADSLGAKPSPFTAVGGFFQDLWLTVYVDIR